MYCLGIVWVFCVMVWWDRGRIWLVGVFVGDGWIVLLWFVGVMIFVDINVFMYVVGCDYLLWMFVCEFFEYSFEY